MKSRRVYAVIILSVIILTTTLTEQSQGYNNIQVGGDSHHHMEKEGLSAKKSSVLNNRRTFKTEGDDDDEDGNSVKKWTLDSDMISYAATSIVLWPIILIIVGAIAIPVALVMLVVFVIPFLAPYEGPDGRRRSLSDGMWAPISLAQEIFQGSRCIERISCQLAKKMNGGVVSGGFLSSGIRHFQDLPLLSDGLKKRISRSFELGQDPNSSCLNFVCKPLSSFSSSRRRSSSSSSSRRRRRREGRSFWGFGLPDYDEMDTIWDKFVKYWGGRYLYVRKLAANKDVKFYPYLPSLG